MQKIGTLFCKTLFGLEIEEKTGEGSQVLNYLKCFKEAGIKCAHMMQAPGNVRFAKNATLVKQFSCFYSDI